MPQVVECGDCGKKLRAADELAGLKVRCPRCESIVRVPALRPLVSDRAKARHAVLDELDLDEPVDPSAALPAEDEDARPARGRRKKKSRRRSRGAEGWPPFSRWWTLAAGAFVIVLAFICPVVAIFVLLTMGGLSAIGLAIIFLVLVLPVIVEHPLLFLQIIFLGMGVGRYTAEQRERGAARFRKTWPAISHLALALGCCGLALFAFECSPWLPPRLAAKFRRKPQAPAFAQPAVVGGPALAAPVADLPESDVVPPASQERADPAGWPRRHSMPAAAPLNSADANSFPGQPALPRAPWPQHAPPQIEMHRLPTVPGDIQATIEAHRRAMEEHQRRLFGNRVGRRAPVIPPNNSQGPTSGVTQPAPAAPRGGL
jgi:DNA-directed RNA polymerase subunit RPC12/RpoP